MTTDPSFLHRDVPALNRRVFRLGLAANYGIEESGIRAAFDHGVNYVFYTGLRSGALAAPLREALARDRERYVVSAPVTLGFYGGGVRRGAEGLLKALQTDYLDVLLLGWLGVTSALTRGVLEQLAELKRSGKVRAVGVSIHDRKRAGELAEDSPLDLLMIRYNAAHPGAEAEIFPRLAQRHPAVVAYTATSWRKLLRRPRGWDRDVMSAGDCYRFCLTSSHVDVVLTAPKTGAEFEANLAGVRKGPLSDDEARWMREFGRAVHG